MKTSYEEIVKSSYIGRAENPVSMNEILKKAEVSVLITFDRAEKLSELLSAFIHSLKTVTTYEK